jgi:hypothetical protein
VGGEPASSSFFFLSGARLCRGPSVAPFHSVQRWLLGPARHNPSRFLALRGKFPCSCMLVMNQNWRIRCFLLPLGASASFDFHVSSKIIKKGCKKLENYVQNLDLEGVANEQYNHSRLVVLICIYSNICSSWLLSDQQLRLQVMLKHHFRQLTFHWSS